MATSVVSICNQALAELPDAPIASLDEQSLQAQECKRVYAQCLAELLESHDWGFANRRIALALIDNDRPDEWSYAYAVPAGVGTPQRVLSAADSPGPGLPIPIDDDDPYRETWSGLADALRTYAVENSVIYTNIADAVLEYGASTVEPTVMPALFARALSLEVASRIAMPLAKNRELKGDLIKQAEVAKERARADDMNRQPQRTTPYLSDMARARAGTVYI